MSGSWYPLAWTDPVPGDPVAVRAAGQEYTAVAERIAQAAGDLRTLTAGITQTSQAVEQMQARAAETAERISTAHDRYQATGTALVDYADALDHAQGLARDALEVARRAAQAIDTADADVRRWATQALDETDTAQAASDEQLAETARHTRQQAEHTLDQARHTLEQARHIRDAAAQVARDLIEATIGTDSLADTLWTGLTRAAGAVGAWFTDAGHWLFDHIDEIATVLGVAALLLAWVPVLGQALAAAALIAGALQLARDTYLALTTDTGWSDVALGALGMITFGIGRLTTQGLRIATNTARAHQGLRTLPVTGQATGAATITSASAAGRAARVVTRATLRLSQKPAWRSVDLWSVMRPAAIVRDLASDLTGIATVVKNPGMFLTSKVGRHAIGEPSVVDNVLEGAHNLRGTPVGTERLMTLFGDLDAARDLRFLVEHGAVLDQGGAALRAWAAGRGAVQIVDIGLVVESVAPTGRP